MRILIAEDDVTSRAMLTAVLQKAGHDVLPTTNGQEALAIMAQENPPQLLILDWLMPYVNGLEVVQQLRAQPSSTPPYIIMLTTKRGKTEAVTALEAGANDYLSKPFDMEELLARVAVGQRMVRLQAELQTKVAELQYQTECQQLVSALSTALATTTSLDTFEQVLTHTLQHLGERCAADRAYFFRFSDDGQSFSNSHEWCAPGISPQKYRLQNLLIQDFTWWQTRLRTPIHIPNVNDLPSEAESEKKILASQQIQALLCIPTLDTTGAPNGFIGFDKLTPYQWPAYQITMFQIVGNTIGSTLERLSIQAQRQELLNRFERIASQVPGVLFQYLIDENGHESIPYLSPRFEEMFDLPVETIKQDASLLQPRFHPDDWPAYRASIGQAMERLDMWSHQYRILHPSGKTYWAEGKAVPQPLPDGSVLWHGYLQDITERQQAELAIKQSHQELSAALQQLEKAQEQLVQQERLAAVGQLSAGIAHEFNNILAVILLHVQMMSQTSKLGAWEREALNIVEERTQTAARLIQQILDFSQHSLIKRTAVDWHTLLQETLPPFQETLPNNITLTLTADPEQSYLVHADTNRLQKLLTNLLLNARDAMPDGGELGLTLTQLSLVEPEGSLPTGEWVRLGVTDTGVGMDATTQAHIFEPFFTTKQVGQGSGLGLSQVQGIVLQHEGHLTIDTAVGQGTTVTVYLPVARE